MRARTAEDRAHGELERQGARLAHELKNPLSGVKALVQLGLQNPAEAASHERLALVEREVARIQEMLRGHLSSTRRRLAAEAEPVELGPLASGVLGALSARAGQARVTLRAQGEARIDGDPRRLEEALLNLVANAIEATPPGGEVSVEVGRRGAAVEVVVRDAGRGMDPDTLRRVGTPFFTTRAEGTGLGVALARAAIARLGGTLTYESEPGNGTSARVVLPGEPG